MIRKERKEKVRREEDAYVRELEEILLSDWKNNQRGARLINLRDFYVNRDILKTPQRKQFYQRCKEKANMTIMMDILS